jgi:hypothetical protein
MTQVLSDRGSHECNTPAQRRAAERHRGA